MCMGDACGASRQTEMAQTGPETCESRLDGAAELLELLHIDVEIDAVDPKPGREDLPCSRNVLRKQRHWEKQLAAKKSRRKEEKLRRKMNRELESGASTDRPQLTKRVMKAIAKERLAEARSTGLKVCVDLSMTDCMSDKEISRLAGQLRRLYGSNKKVTRPFHLFLTDLREDSRLYRECVRMNDGFLNYTMDITEESCLDLFPPETVVYLTPDAEEALETVDADKVYVLGGLVDESIQKKLSLSRARELSIQTARLPIDEYMVKKNNTKNFHSKILAVNQVFDILLTFCDSGSWTEALQTWFPPGKGYVVAAVTLNCEVEHPSAGWSFYWYKAVPDLSEKSYSYELLPDGSGTAQDSYIIDGQTHTAGYVCRAGRGDPEYHTDHSEPKFVWSADVHSAASLTVSPDRVQHFTSDSVSLTCEGNSAEWRVKKFTEDDRLTSDCRTMTGSTCNINTSQSGTAVYWCESGSGEFSSAVNITVQDDPDAPILVSPVHPVTEGASVSLSCSLRTQKILSNVFFYHNDKLIQSDTREELKISAVSKSDEGFYKCEYSGRESPQSWMLVKVTVSAANSSSAPVWLIVGLVCGVSLLIILLLLLYRCRTTNSPANEQTVNQDDQQQVYSSLLHGDLCVYETLRYSENTENGQSEGDYVNVVRPLKVINKMRQRADPEESSDYCNVNPNPATAL